MNNAANPVPSSSVASGRSEQDKKAWPIDQRMKHAMARIDASRSALIVCLAPNPPASRDTTSGTAGDRGAEPFFAQTLAARIKRNGLLQGSWSTVRTLARRWWTRQPWHSSVELVSQTLMHQVSPLIQRHPLATLAVGAALGVGLVAAVSAMRPLALHNIQRQTSPWRDRWGSLIWSQLGSASVQMALAGALAAWLADQGSRGTDSSSRSADGAPRSTPSNMTPRSVS